MPIAYTLAHGEGLISIEFLLSLCDLRHTDIKHIKIHVSSAAPRLRASRQILHSAPSPHNMLSGSVSALRHHPISSSVSLNPSVSTHLMSLGGAQAIKVKDGMSWGGGCRFISFTSPFHMLFCAGPVFMEVFYRNNGPHSTVHSCSPVLTSIFVDKEECIPVSEAESGMKYVFFVVSAC